ncbi:ABC transporter substrate-binding protein [Actinobaculum suis]|uniref:thiamine ABC transporter substrate-binding protein n=1 Tax=Actinobaculum suis TaxID=1657 RepID=UPI0008086EA0|nr:thiamine ABC transporter substrate-binding protein [Actinobaculum suis]OCA94760.1 ABC transporter substrate-binding protein [Actinobaculum suis]
MVRRVHKPSKPTSALTTSTLTTGTFTASALTKIAGLLSVITLALAGCSGNTNTASTTNGQNPTTSENAPAPGTNENKNGGKAGVVTVMTHDSFNVPPELISKFEEESGYRVVLTAPGDAGTVVNQLVLAEGKPVADAVYGIDTFTAYQALDANVLEPYTPAALATIANTSGTANTAATAGTAGTANTAATTPDQGRAAPTGQQPAQLDGKLTPIDHGEVCVNYDKKWFADNNLAVPETFADLAEPQYAKLLVTTNPAASSPGLAFLAATAEHTGQDREALREYWQQLFAGGTLVEESWADSYNADFSAKGSGEYPLVVSYSSSPAAEEGATGNLPQTCIRQTEYAGVLRGAKNPAGAQAFIDFLLSPDVQAAIAPNMYMYPVADVPLPEAWEKYAPRVTNPIETDPKTFGQNRAELIRDWREVAGR